jgi:hypothetical protein
MAGMHPPKGWPPQKEFNSCGCPTEVLGLNNSTKFNSFCGIMEQKLDEKYIIITFSKF